MPGGPSAGRPRLLLLFSPQLLCTLAASVLLAGLPIFTPGVHHLAMATSISDFPLAPSWLVLCLLSSAQQSAPGQSWTLPPRLPLSPEPARKGI